MTNILKDCKFVKIIVTMKVPRAFILGCFLWCQVFPVFAGTQKKIDSLEQLLTQTNIIQQKVKASIQLTRLYREISPKKSVQYGHLALTLSQKINDNKSITEALLYLAVGELYTGNYDSCIIFSKKAIQLSPKERQQATNSFAYNLMCVSYKRIGELDKALEYAKKSYEIRSKSTDTVNIAGSLDNIAHIYRQKGNYEKSMEYSLKALDLFKKTRDTLEIAKMYAGMANLYLDMENKEKGLANLLSADKMLTHKHFTIIYADVQFNIGNIFLKEKQYDTALFYFKKSVPVYQNTGVEDGVAEAWQNMALCYAGKGRLKQGLDYMYKAYNYFRHAESQRLLASVEQSLGAIFMQSGDYDSAEYYLQQAYKLSRKINYANKIKSSLKSLAQLYEKTNSPKALPVYKQYISYRDSIDGKEVQLKLDELQAKYESSKKQKKILQLEVAGKTEKVKIHALIFIIIITVLIFVTLTVYIYLKRKSERIICHQKNLISRRNEMLAKSNLEQSRIQAKLLQEKLNSQTRQLTMHSLNMMQKTKLLQDIDASLKEITDAKGDKQLKMLTQLKQQLAHSLKSENDWHLFKMYFEQINKGFIEQLKKINPDLTENEVRLSTLIKIGMTPKETASIMNISPNSVKNARHRLKVKLGLQADEDLNKFISNLSHPGSQQGQ